MNKLKKTLVFTATYNEAENIEKLISSIKKQPFNLDILIVDDNSPDGTKDIIISLILIGAMNRLVKFLLQISSKNNILKPILVLNKKS